MMPRGLFLVSVANGLPAVTSNIFSGGDGCGWVRCSEEVGGKCIVMINAAEAVFATLGAPLDAVAVEGSAETYGTTGAALKRTFVGKTSLDIEALPIYQPPGVIPTPPDGYPVAATGLTELLAAAQSGDTVSVPEGTYSGDFTVPAGVTLQPEAGARVVIDIVNEFDMRGATVKDIELFSSDTDRAHVQTGITMSAVNSRLIGCIVHDLHASGVDWFSSGVGEVSECLFFNNGYRNPDNSGHGHCIYSHNNIGGTRRIDNNILLGGLGKYALQIYSGGANNLKDYTVTRNITAKRPTIAGGGLGVSNLTYSQNVQYGNAIYIGRYSSNNVDCTVTDNLYSAGAFIEITDFQTVTEADNAEVTTERVVIYPCTQSTRKLAHIAVFNPAAADTVEIDLAALELEAGDYALRNAQNLAEEHFFTLGENAVVSVPMTGWTAALRIGEPAQSVGSIFPTFGIFILESV